MFSKIKNAIIKFKNGIADKHSIEELIKEIQRNLIKADIDIKIIFELSENIRKKAKEPPNIGISQKEHIINCVYEELVKILGQKKQDLNFKKDIIVLAGLYGSGKTTTAVKLAYYYRKHNFSVGLICADFDRPAAYEQLNQFASNNNFETFGINNLKNQKNLIDVINNGIDYFDNKNIIIIDTAGRSSLNDELKKELKLITDNCKAKQSRNTKTYLVCSGDIGKAAKNLAISFKESAGNIDGIILTKMDSSAKGGGAISSCYGAKAPVLFIGNGEKIQDFEEYDPVRFTSRLLGMGDLKGLIEKIQNSVNEEEMQKIMQGELNIETFYLQIKNIKKMGSFSKIFEMIPGFNSMKIPENIMDTGQKNLKKYEAIINSMTKQEKHHPEIIDQYRINRISKGSGVQTSDVKEMLKQFRMIKKMQKKMQSKSFMKGGMGNILKNMKGIF